MQSPSAPARALPAGAVSRAIREAWEARVHAEYRSAALTQQLAHLWLVAGVSPDLVRDAQDVVRDELDHAADALAVLQELGGGLGPMDEAGLHLPWSTQPARPAVLAASLELLALNESLAVPLFAAMRRRARHSSVLAALDRIGQDEPRHAALGWTFLAWAVEVWPDARPTLRAGLDGAIARLRAAYGAFPHDRWDPDDPRFAWGLLDGATYAEILEQHVAGTLATRLRELGLT